MRRGVDGKVALVRGGDDLLRAFAKTVLGGRDGALADIAVGDHTGAQGASGISALTRIQSCHNLSFLNFFNARAVELDHLDLR